MGWYHSHPSYGCWLSGIDVKTQELFQISTDPFLAIVVDPIKSANLRIFYTKNRTNRYRRLQSTPQQPPGRISSQRKGRPQAKSCGFWLSLPKILSTAHRDRDELARNGDFEAGVKDGMGY